MDGTHTSLRRISLNDKYTIDHGSIVMTGIQALTRLLLDQRARDAAAGLNTAGFVSGYRGSPLGGFDLELWRARKFLEAKQIVFQPGINEDLGATAVWGSQQTTLFPQARVQGVFGLWYGKAPGVDRSLDVFRHANAAGSSPYGGALLVAGDDHDCKSSTLPSQSEIALAHAEIPVLNPASVQEVLDYGLIGFALSRYAGCWVGMIALADTMDSAGVVEVGLQRARTILPAGFALPAVGPHIRLGDTPLAQEERMRLVKLPAVQAFVRENNLNRVFWPAARTRLGIITTGKCTDDVRQALEILGIDEAQALQLGVKLLKVAMPWPLQADDVRDFARGCETLLVVEAKRNLMEDQVRAALYGLPEAARPLVLGKTDKTGRPLLSELKSLGAADIARVLADLLPQPSVTARWQDYAAALAAGQQLLLQHQDTVQRAAFFCSGCPHNTSTNLPEGSRGLAGIGCHYMVTWMGRETSLFSQMGGEGVHWVGQAPFTDEKHVFVNLGDGTYYHSGLLAIRQAVAAKVNVTFKILFNDAVAMTGGQPVDGPLSPQLIARQCLAEGATRVVAMVDDPARYGRAHGFPAGVPIVGRERLEAIQKELRTAPGTTILIYDQTCAAEKRRRRKRGTMPDPAKRLFINEAVCEGCGDCSVASNCLSVEPVETEFGRKRRINQSSCNKDYSCANGFCPSFVEVLNAPVRKNRQQLADAALPAPTLPGLSRPYNILITGIGGTGITTVAAVLNYAAFLEGRAALELDMNGLAQKGGAVLSHLRLAAQPDQLHGARIAPAEADLLLACDMVVAVGKDGLPTMRAARTAALVNADLSPTAGFVQNNNIHYDPEAMITLIGRVARRLDRIPATRLAEQVLGDSLYANMLLVGAAYQHGLLPLSAEAVEAAIALNGAAVEANQAAFRLGRRLVAEPGLLGTLLPPERPAPASTLPEIIARREELLTAYQGRGLARRYRRLVDRVQAAEQQAMPGRQLLTEAVARAAAKLMAYKDEYEVARLYSDGNFQKALRAQFADGGKLQVLLAPPLIAPRDPDTGKPRKIRFGAWIFPVFALLQHGKYLRGTPLDIFGWTAERRMERQLGRDYLALLDRLLPQLQPANHAVLVEIARLPDMVRGFGHVKEANVARYRARLTELLSKLATPVTVRAA